MADSTIAMSYKYNVEMLYLDVAKDTYTEIKNECVKSLVVDHMYDDHTMPTMYAIMKLDKELVDDMIANCNTNLMIVAISKYDELSETDDEIEVFRKKFVYFLPNSMNVNDPADYNEGNIEETSGDTYTEVTMGLLAVDHLNNNKRYCELNVKNNTSMDCVRYVTRHMSNIVIEPFSYNPVYDRLIMPPTDSVNRALEFLNDQAVFYSTKYRYYQDFNYTYIMSSAGTAVQNRNETYSTILINIKDINEEEANDVGMIANKTVETYEVPVNYANTQVYDNTVINKSKNKIKAITSTGVNEISLKNTASYSTDKYESVRLNNDNENMAEVLENDYNDQAVLLYVGKTGLDSELFTINKKITVHHIERYQDYNGVYLLYRKRDCYLREDTTFKLFTMLNLRRICDE